MIKKLNFLLIIFPIILSILLVINIYKYLDNKNNNQNIINNTQEYNIKIQENNNILEKLTNEINTLKEEKKDKIWEYERWLKWDQEIKEKIN